MSVIEESVAQFREAVLSANSPVLNNLLADRLSYGHSDGHVEGKADLINKLSDGTYQFITMDLSNQTIAVIDNIAIVRHQLDAKTNDEGKPNEAHLFVLLVWQKNADKWQLIARQAVKNLPQ